MLGSARDGAEPAADRTSDALLWLEWEASPTDEGWLVSYADLLSVILAMVVLLLGRMVVAGTPVADVHAEVPAEVSAAAERALPESVDLVEPIERAAPVEPVDAKNTLARQIEQRFGGTIRAEAEESALLLTVADVVLFDSASADLQPAARLMLGELAKTLRRSGEIEISVEGHTDDRPLQGGAFTSNWDLAAGRANAVTRFLLDHGFPARRVRSISYADTRPVAANDTAAGRAANRRVELRIEFVGDAADARNSIEREIR